MWYIVKNKPCLSPASNLDTVKCFLAEESLEKWESCEATVTNKVVLVPIDLPKNPEGKNESDDQEDQSEIKHKS